MNIAAYRRSMAAGIGFVVLLVAGALLVTGNSPDVSSDKSGAAAARDYLHYLSSSGHRVALVISAYVLVAAGLAYIWFTLGLRDRLGSQSTGGRLVAGFGIFGSVALAAAGMCAAGTAGSVSAGGEPLPASGDGIRATLDLAFPFIFVVFGLATAAVIGIVAAAALRGEGWPKWVGYTGILGCLGALLGVVFLPFALPALWYLAVAISGVTSKSPSLAQQREGKDIGITSGAERPVHT